MLNKPIRLTEWSTQQVELARSVREQLAQAVDHWVENNNLPQAPLSFGGADGRLLSTANFVGVVEAAGQAIEIYPKLDRYLLAGSQEVTESRYQSAMASLMWMLEVASHDSIYEADSSSLEMAPSSFLDLWAILLGRNLNLELQLGLARAYQPREDNSSTVRGRILFQDHIVANFGRPDRVYCGWDEFTEDRPLNRILKCACRFLSGRVQNTDARHLLGDSLAMLDEVDDIDVGSALRLVDRIVWDRSMERFRLPFKLAVRLLQSIGHETIHGGQQTYVFLLDMNQVFEDFVGAYLENSYGVPVQKQAALGTLLISPRRIQQIPDFVWRKGGQPYIADAKYKPFSNWIQQDELYGKGMGIADIRQLICYGLLHPVGEEVPELQILYPYVGEHPLPDPIFKKAFTGMSIAAVPIPTKAYLSEH